MSAAQVLAVIVSVALTSCRCLESGEPEFLLRPRDFNPHPHLARATHGQRGPVLFPAAPRQPDAAGRSFAPPGPEPFHPYANVARKQRIQFSGRFSPDAEQENNINPRVYTGLASYAAKVLKKESTFDGHGDPSLASEKKNYAFSYAVRDRTTGDDFSHSQSQSGKATNGEYRVKLPDGRVQIVSYTADKNGYKADVRYAEGEPEERPAQHQQPHHDQKKLFVYEGPEQTDDEEFYRYEQVTPRYYQAERHTDVEYSTAAPSPSPPPQYYDYQAERHTDVEYSTAAPSPSPPPQYYDYQAERHTDVESSTAAPSPYYDYQHQYPSTRLVQYVPRPAPRRPHPATYVLQNQHEHSRNYGHAVASHYDGRAGNKFSVPTLAPQEYDGNVVSTVAPDYSELYLSTPKYVQASHYISR